MNLSHSKFLFLILSILFICVYPLQSPQTSQVNHFQYGARIIPHPKKAHKGGEDAYFANNHILAVADGVSFWNKEGIDPSKYSKELCNLVGILIEEKNKTFIGKPKAIIKEAAQRNTNLGTSTLLIIDLDQTKPIIRTSYIGDSTYVIYRKQNGVWKAIFEAEGQQHKFNYPYQLGYKSATHPNKALEFTHDVQDKDIVFAASDGIFDNMSSEQVLAELIKFIGENDELKNPQEAANNITEAAFKLSVNRKYRSPFAIKSEIEGRDFKIGGKSDDITAIVGQVRIPNQNKDETRNTAKSEAAEVKKTNTQEKVKGKKIDYIEL